jgi:hypothetical protein
MLVLAYVVAITVPLDHYSSGGFLTVDASVFAKEFGWYVLIVTIVFFGVCLMTGDRRENTVS